MSRLLSLKRVAERLDVSAKTVQRWVDDGEFPPPTHMLPKDQKRWSEAVVEGWIAMRAVGFSGGFGTPVKGKTGRTNPDKRGQEGTSVGGASVN